MSCKLNNLYMKITGWKSKTVLRFTHTWFCWCCFSSVYKGYHFVLLIWYCLGIEYGDEVIRICYFRRFCGLSFFIELRFEFIYEIIFVRFFSDLFSWIIWKKANIWNIPSSQLHKCSSTANCWYSGGLICCQ